MIAYRLRAGIAAALALLQPLGAAALEARAPRHAPAVRPAVWQVRGPHATLWLFGTIHALPPHFEWQTPALRQIIARADRLVLEAVIDRDDPRSAQALMRLGTAAHPLPPITERVPVRLRPRLVTMAGKAGVPVALLDRLKTWAAAMVLFGVTVNGLGVSGDNGVEEQLKASFRAAGKPVEGLETLDQQLGFFDTLDEGEQRDFLVSVVDGKDDDAADFGRMLGAWSHGDERAIRASFDKDMKADGALRKVLIARRNARWAQLIAARLKQSGTGLLAVGAGHLVGPDSVQAMLLRLGYRARRVQ
ncbi:TraB/GumN family protein [Sphingomonas morindae]|uniref:TraB/GumN family protein n=1 Tax=Sphingomonas morindae TaxID=1541170 RepID=A0ABY4X5W0_9SPHN|nr:TraB/GumN family protein [Sphingomonas morindae]USI72264.1 TraB/GumN family protein [Sphingomonas morindae]